MTLRNPLLALIVALSASQAAYAGSPPAPTPASVGAGEMILRLPGQAEQRFEVIPKPSTGPTVPPPSTSQPAPRVRDVLGGNLDGPSSSSPAPILYADPMKFARKWGTFAHPEDQAAPVDARGWPTSATSGVIVFEQRPNAAGVYRIRYPGDAKLTLKNGGTSTADVRYDPVSKTSSGTINITGSAMWLCFAGQVREVELRAPGCDWADRWNPQALTALRKIRAIRFMDLLKTNNSGETTWEGRPLPADASYLREGIPWEDTIDLATILQLECLWINVPHAADDDYVTRTGQLFRERGPPGCAIIVEDSNEKWNSAAAFRKQYDHNAAAAAAAGVAGDKLITDGGINFNPGFMQWKYVARRTMRLRELMGSDPRFRFVLGSHHAYGLPNSPAYMARMQLEAVAKWVGPPDQFFYGITTAPYFSVGKAAATQPTLTAAEYSERLHQSAATYWGGAQAAHRSLASKYRLRYLAYEGGLHDTDFVAGQAFLDGQRLPRTGQAIELMLRQWYTGGKAVTAATPTADGGDEFFYFVVWSHWTPRFAWGAASHPADLAAPKFQALERVADWLAAAPNN